MPLFYSYTPHGNRSPEDSFLVVEHDGERLQIEWATFEGSGSGERRNEDSLLVAGREHSLLFGVLDGVTPIPSARVHNGGHVAARQATAGILRAFLDGLDDPGELLLRGNAAIRQASRELGITPGDALETLGSTATLVYIDLHAGTFRYASISDSALVLKRRETPAAKLTGNRVIVFEESAMSKLQAASDIAQELAQGESAFWQTVMRNRRRMNAPGGTGYGVLNGMDDELVRQYIELLAEPIPLAEVERFILFSDGAVLNERPAAADMWSRFDEAVFRLGSLPYLEHVRAREDEDPTLQIYPRVKPHDDATLIAVNRES